METWNIATKELLTSILDLATWKHTPFPTRARFTKPNEAEVTKLKYLIACKLQEMWSSFLESQQRSA